ncbi:hypothetical protein B0H17DRAFT_1148021 [Mycena rosella]|uniref:Uncharacterized protein n=1 Tax=Mycena rosella TaxID=1033263 RepID=A0AAD7CJ22_MYCRO|nr:hypothetical protein B0H17DRAFT_1148021 [Mycena rosella]
MNVAMVHREAQQKLDLKLHTRPTRHAVKVSLNFREAQINVTKFGFPAVGRHLAEKRRTATTASEPTPVAKWAFGAPLIRYHTSAGNAFRKQLQLKQGPQEVARNELAENLTFEYGCRATRVRPGEIAKAGRYTAFSRVLNQLSNGMATRCLDGIDRHDLDTQPNIARPRSGHTRLDQFRPGLNAVIGSRGHAAPYRHFPRRNFSTVEGSAAFISEARSDLKPDNERYGDIRQNIIDFPKIPRAPKANAKSVHFLRLT